MSRVLLASFNLVFESEFDVLLGALKTKAQRQTSKVIWSIRIGFREDQKNFDVILSRSQKLVKEWVEQKRLYVVLHWLRAQRLAIPNLTMTKIWLLHSTKQLTNLKVESQLLILNLNLQQTTQIWSHVGFEIISCKLSQSQESLQPLQKADDNFSVINEVPFKCQTQTKNPWRSTKNHRLQNNDKRKEIETRYRNCKLHCSGPTCSKCCDGERLSKLNESSSWAAVSCSASNDF